jgi:hypothetical protein
MGATEHRRESACTSATIAAWLTRDAGAVPVADTFIDV